MVVASESWRRKYYDKPPLRDGLEFYLQAFFDLIGDRREALAPIPFTALDAYAARHGIDGDAFTHFRILVTALDAEERRISAKKIEQQRQR